MEPSNSFDSKITNQDIYYGTFCVVNGRISIAAGTVLNRSMNCGRNDIHAVNVW